jgi:hypothetical protein
MLPDYPSLKKEIREVLDVFLKKRVEQYSTAIRQIPKTKIFEGKGTVIKRRTGEEDPTEFMSSETGFELKYSEIPEMSIGDILAKLDQAALNMAGNMESTFFKSISEQLDKAGRTFGQKGEPLTGKTILNVLRNIFISFDKDGRPSLPSIFHGPKLEKSMKRAIKEINENPELKKEEKEILIQKKEEWRAEEASRKLVG